MSIETKKTLHFKLVTMFTLVTFPEAVIIIMLLIHYMILPVVVIIGYSCLLVCVFGINIYMLEVKKKINTKYLLAYRIINIPFSIVLSYYYSLKVHYSFYDKSIVKYLSISSRPLFSHILFNSLHLNTETTIGNAGIQVTKESKDHIITSCKYLYYSSIWDFITGLVSGLALGVSLYYFSGNMNYAVLVVLWFTLNTLNMSLLYIVFQRNLMINLERNNLKELLSLFVGIVYSRKYIYIRLRKPLSVIEKEVDDFIG